MVDVNTTKHQPTTSFDADEGEGEQDPAQNLEITMEHEDKLKEKKLSEISPQTQAQTRQKLELRRFNLRRMIDQKSQ